MPPTPYSEHMQKLAAQMRARVHTQSFANAFQASMHAVPDERAVAADQRLRKLRALCDLHARTFDPSFKKEAMGILQTLPLKSTTDDPHMVYTLGALRSCAYLGATSSPATYNLLNHITRHTFMLDAHNIYHLCATLSELQHPQTSEVLSIILPRATEVVTDMTAYEARRVLYSFEEHELLTEELCEKILAVQKGAVNELEVMDLVNAVGLVSRTKSESIARDFLQAVTPRVCSVLRERTEELHRFKMSLINGSQGEATFTCASATSSSAPASLAAGPRASAEMSPTEQVAQRKEEQRYRAFWRAEFRAVCALQRVLHGRISWLCWAPKPLLNELVRCAVLWSEPLPLPATYGASGDETVMISERVDHATDLLEAKSNEAISEVQALPQLERSDLCGCLKMLHFTSYRHRPAMRILSSRISCADQTSDAARSTKLPSRLVEAVEALAYFYAVDCAPAFASMMGEVMVDVLAAVADAPAEVQQDSSHLDVNDLRMSERIVLRALLSCGRMLSTRMENPVRKVRQSERLVLSLQEEAADAILGYAVSLATLPSTESYLKMALLTHKHTSKSLEARENSAKNFAGAAHFLYSATILLALVADKRDRPLPSVNQAALGQLKHNVAQIVDLIGKLGASASKGPTKELVEEIAFALRILKTHPQLLDGATLPP